MWVTALYCTVLYCTVPQVRVTADHGLEVRGVGAEDGGQYTCQLDVWGHTQTAVHNLTVLGMFI